MPRSKGNIHARLSSFVGRERELDELIQLLDGGTRLLSILGPPGVGKSRLAIELALRSSASTSASAWLVDLAEARDEAGLNDAVSGTLPIVPERPGTRTALAEGLERLGPTLLVLDNCGAAVDAVAAFVGECVTRIPTLRLIVTSRQRLAVPGECVFDLNPLPLPEELGSASHNDAVRLFIERARELRWGYAPENEELAAIVQLCRTLEGLPLGLELAASQIRLLSATQILSRLRVPTMRPTDVGRLRSKRHSSLREAIRSSCVLLNDVERSLLAQCAVFRGGFDVEAAEAILSIEGEDEVAMVVQWLGSLRDKSLLCASHEAGTPRYRLLGAIADAIIPEAPPEALTRARQRHVTYFCERARRCGEAMARGEREWAFEHLRTEEANLGAALTYAGEAAEPPDQETRLLLAWALAELAAERDSTEAVHTLLRDPLRHPPAGFPKHLRDRCRDLHARASRLTGGLEACDAELSGAAGSAALLAGGLADDQPAMHQGQLRLRLHWEGAWFEWDGQPRVSLHRRKSLGRVLEALVARRLAAPGEPLSTHALFEAGWPGQRISPEAACNRVYVAVATLRQRGLDRVLLKKPTGYLLDPDGPIELVGSPTSGSDATPRAAAGLLAVPGRL